MVSAKERISSKYFAYYPQTWGYCSHCGHSNCCIWPCYQFAQLLDRGPLILIAQSVPQYDRVWWQPALFVPGFYICPGFGHGVQGPRRQLLIINHQRWMDIVTEAKTSLSCHDYSPHSTQWIVLFYKFPQLCCSCMHNVWHLWWHTIWNENSGPQHLNVPLDPKSLQLSWISGASFGLTPFWSDFIDYVACAIPVRDVTKINIVNPHWDYTT